MEKRRTSRPWPGEGRRKRRNFTPEQKQEIVEAFGEWEGTRKDFCSKHGVCLSSLNRWCPSERSGSTARSTPRVATPRERKRHSRRVYSPEERRQAVEAFESAIEVGGIP